MPTNTQKQSTAVYLCDQDDVWLSDFVLTQIQIGRTQSRQYLDLSFCERGYSDLFVIHQAGFYPLTMIQICSVLLYSDYICVLKAQLWDHPMSVQEKSEAPQDG